ncbi:hypothetical protein FRP1_28185 [Pseudonocardia sp. EC080625-04]|uniref:hypothetical protein n=1 Tax=Pseudonocardia sp. EC080625-04 TaxID=1096868 RepID=UPI0006CB44A7|nr:hypothetical protein [Pseudonocardia sp. EC080625-04]ALE75786.1 hypothetical protein FRP1_28185 [Pseudonocardia sp. EC080625-04]
MTERHPGPAARRGAVPVVLQDYLRRLDAAARALPSGERQDLRARVWTDVAAAAGPAPTGDRLARVLGELGPPEGLVPARAGAGRVGCGTRRWCTSSAAPCSAPGSPG